MRFLVVVIFVFSQFLSQDLFANPKDKGQNLVNTEEGLDSKKAIKNKRTQDDKENLEPQAKRQKRKTRSSDPLKTATHYIDVLSPIKIHSFDEINPEDLIASQGTTIIFFDLDKTLIRPDLFLHNFLPAEQSLLLNEFYEKGFFKGQEGQFQEFLEYIKSTQGNYFSKTCIKDEALVDPKSLFLLRTLKEKGAIIMGLTARKYIIADASHEKLKKLGIDFGELSGLQNHAPPLLPGVGLKNGIFFTGNQFSKFQMLPSLTRFIKQILNKPGPFTLYHFEDNPREIEAFYNEPLPEEEKSISFRAQPFFYLGHAHFLNDLRENKSLIFKEIEEEFYFNRFLKSIEEKNKNFP